jgi:sugar lactone lactonase YvrE
MTHDGESLWVASGTLTINLSPTGNRSGLFRYKDGAWTIYNRTDYPKLRGRDEVSGNFDDQADYVGVAADPTSNKVWVGTYYEGAFSIDLATDEVEVYDELNSSLSFAVGEAAGRVRVGQVAVDAAGNTYFSNALSDTGRPVSVRSPDGQWAALGGECDRNEAFAVAIDGSGFIWLLHGINAGGGVTVIDPGADLFDPSDDQCRLFTPSNSELPANEVRSLAVDLDGDVWIGTSQGVMVFDCGSAAISSSSCDGREIVVEDEIGNTGLLLETEDCFSITIDGANRKWVGTGGGAYLLSEDGREQLAFFDEDNSPLLDNFVRDIAINPKNGTVYFGTEDGITSYRGEATSAGTINRKELIVFPNPVEPGYDGVIAIEGVSRNATVKITDLSGKLVFETEALGGQVLWNGADYNGRRVQSGVYLVFASTNGIRFENPDSAVGKIVFIR